jgi:hypothetical protein
MTMFATKFFYRHHSHLVSVKIYFYYFQNFCSVQEPGFLPPKQQQQQAEGGGAGHQLQGADGLQQHHQPQQQQRGDQPSL